MKKVTFGIIAKGDEIISSLNDSIPRVALGMHNIWGVITKAFFFFFYCYTSPLTLTLIMIETRYKQNQQV